MPLILDDNLIMGLQREILDSVKWKHFVSVTCSERYRDLIDAADSIVDMKKCSELVSLL